MTTRTARALILTWLGRADEALQVLEYSSPIAAYLSKPLRAEWSAARSLALRSLGRAREAAHELAVARNLFPKVVEVFELS